MVRLNKTPLTTSQINKLLSQFTQVLAPSDSDHAHAVLAEILGTEEQIMLAKRLASIVLLAEGFSPYKISQLLKLSESTVATIVKKMESGEYQKILATLGKNKNNYFSILHALDSILHLGGILPHYNGLDRYRNL